MFNLQIDTRETLLKNYFTDKYNNKYQTNISIEIKQLDLGDIIILKENQPIMIIERKTICDLCSSIRDGRHKEQKLRLINSYNPNIIFYLIEGSITQEVNKIKKYSNDEKMVYGSMINCLVRDNIKIIKTENIQETIKYIEYIISKLVKQPEIFTKNLNQVSTSTNQSTITNNSLNLNSNTDSITADYLTTIKTKKKDNMTPEMCYLFQLCQIPGVSSNSAKVISTKYPNMTSLINEYNNTLELNDKELMLCELKMTSQTGKVRKLGPVLSKRIYNYLI